MRFPEGLDALKNHFNKLLTTGEAPEDYYEAFVCLVPKTTFVTGAQELRPINLIENIQKLYVAILCMRIRKKWLAPRFQLGGLQGCQTLDALMTAHCCIDKESVQKRYGVWLSCDVASAFDTVNHAKLSDIIASKVDPAHYLEAARLLQLSTDARLHFQWGEQQCTMQQTQGIQQGGAQSAMLFSCMLGLVLDELHKDWMDRGEPSNHGMFIWGYVDDILVAFTDWDQAVRLSHELRQRLHTLGLQLNYKKTTFFTHRSMLEVSRDSFPSGSVPRLCPWAESVMYLRKPLGHWDSVACSNGNKLLGQTTMICNKTMEDLFPIWRSLHWNMIPQALRFMTK